eukprot:TRINITY_DN23913_c0_g1_i1.p1 TRINITY_DN23913_c0_g1~~TRINITY_DN23913_c0_g1_i1.p1  ORF type:complete len:277 (-),score=42.88 TRINITY_DN23913_c0_g1_i1:431-1261(-)
MEERSRLGEGATSAIASSSSALSVSVIVPTLNEESGLPQVLAALSRLEPPAREVIVADAASTDNTVNVARAANASVICSRPGRAWQMNAGAMIAKGEVLLFLHADTLLPPGALKAVLRVLEDPAVLGGCFQLRFDGEEKSFTLRVWGLCTRLWVLRTPRLVYGDRAIFVRTSVFKSLGMYKEWPLLEDVDFAMRLAGSGGPRSFAFIPLDVITSSRRLLEVGPLRQQLLNIFIMICWYVGFSPERLRRFYRYKAVDFVPGGGRLWAARDAIMQKIR